MADGIPVMIHLDAQTFRVLEKIAAAQDTRMNKYIADHLTRSVARHIMKGKPHGAQVRATPEQRHKRLTDVQLAELVDYTRRGWSLAEIATRLGCSAATVSYQRSKLRGQGLL